MKITMNRTLRITCQVLSLVALAAISLYLFPKYNTLFKYHFEVGQPWGYGLMTAEFDFPIYKTDEQLAEERANILSDYTPCYTFVADARQRDLYVVSLEEMERINKLGCNKISIRHNRVATAVPVESVYTPKTAFQLSGNEVDVNLVYDTITSENLRQNLLASISLTQGMVQAGEKIIDTGEIVSSEDYQILESLRRALEEKNVSHKQSVTSTVGCGLLIAILLSIFVLYLYIFRRKLLDDLNNMLFFTLLMGIIIATAFLVLRHAPVGWVYLIPFAWGPIITRVFYDSRTAVCLHLITVFIVSIAVPAPYMFIILQVAVGMVAVASLRDMTQRAQLAQTAAWGVVSYAVVYTAIVMVLSGNMHDIDYQYYIYFLINSVLVICSYGVIYLFERTFGLVSNITLVELTNVNSNLMLEFAEKAPGTFQHSLQVSNLATEAAKRIGAKVLLVRTGALYHDIGKMANPEYFTENQIPGCNPLLSMPTAEAAQVVIAHTANGERIARRNHLPEVIVHFIRSHHGTSVVRYFYNTAVNQAHALKEAGKETPEVNIADYTYPGPKPSTKEAAILMMADAIEARSRSLTDFTEEAVSKMVDSMIDQQVSDGQFAETPLSFKDLEDIRAVFKEKLLAMNHHRIAYPDIKK